MAETCGNCRYFDAAMAGRATGECRRYPRRLTKLPGEWCGEWAVVSTHGAKDFPGSLVNMPLEPEKQQPEGERPKIEGETA